MSAQRKDLRPSKERAASARVMVHPCCSVGAPRFQAFCDGLGALGYDMTKLSISLRGLGLMDELVRKIEETPTRGLYERFDGTRFSKAVA